MRSLFDIKPKEPTPEQPKRKRGRPRKYPVPEVPEPKPVNTEQATEQPKKRRGRPPKVRTPEIVIPPKEVTKEENNQFEEYTKYVDIEPYVPCEFMVKTSEKRFKLFYGYIDSMRKVVTWDSYLFFLRRKYQNMSVRQVGCIDMDDCPLGYPACDKCPKFAKL